MPKLAMRRSMMMPELAIWLVLFPNATFCLLVLAHAGNLIFGGFALNVIRSLLVLSLRTVCNFTRFCPSGYFADMFDISRTCNFFKVISLPYTSNLHTVGPTYTHTYFLMIMVMVFIYAQANSVVLFSYRLCTNLRFLPSLGD